VNAASSDVRRFGSCALTALVAVYALCGLFTPRAAAQSAGGADDSDAPAIAALRRAIAAGADPDSLAGELARRLERGRGPIVERIPGDSFSLVTFAWVGDSMTRNVTLITPFTLVDFAAGRMRRLEPSRIWARSLRVRNDARFLYRFGPNDSEVPFERERNLMERMRAWKQDPFNPRTFDFGAFGTASVLELPDAPRSTASVPPAGQARGEVAAHRIASTALGDEREYWVYTPSGYRPTDPPSPLLVLADGDSYRTLLDAPATLDNLIAAHAVPRLVAVLVANPPDTRERDLACSPVWERFLTRELLPAVRRRFRVTSRADSTIVGGYSLGGLAAACAALRHPEAFGNVVAQSGAFYRAPVGEAAEWVAGHVATSPRARIRWYLDIGLLETAAVPSRDPSMLTASRHLRDVLLAKGYRVTYRELYSGHEMIVWKATLAGALTALMGRGPDS
jgi:enterochelin esterase family protein